MKKLLWIISLSVMIAAFTTPAYCTDSKSEQGYNGHFGDMDLDNNDTVNWDEFKQFFPHATEDVFKEADTSNDGEIDHDEWHSFKEKKGYSHKNKD